MEGGRKLAVGLRVGTAGEGREECLRSREAWGETEAGVSPQVDEVGCSEDWSSRSGSRSRRT